MKVATSFLVLLAVGCATTQKPVESGYLIGRDRWVEYNKLEPAPLESPNRHVVASEDVDTVEWKGVCMPEELAQEYARYNISYKQLRVDYEQDRTVWRVHRDLYETQVQLDAEELSRREPTWLEKNDAYLMGIGGFALGALSVIAVVYAERGGD